MHTLLFNVTNGGRGVVFLTKVALYTKPLALMNLKTVGNPQLLIATFNIKLRAHAS